MQPVEQGVGFIADTKLVNPQQRTITIIGTSLLVGFGMLTVISHQSVEVLVNQLLVKNKCRRLHIRKRLHSNISVLMLCARATAYEQ